MHEKINPLSELSHTDWQLGHEFYLLHYQGLELFCDSWRAKKYECLDGAWGDNNTLGSSLPKEEPHGHNRRRKPDQTGRLLPEPLPQESHYYWRKRNGDFTESS